MSPALTLDKRSDQDARGIPREPVAAPTLPAGTKRRPTSVPRSSRRGTDSPAAKGALTPIIGTPQGPDSPGAEESAPPEYAAPRGPVLHDPILWLHAQVVADLEAQRIANENRLRTLTTTDPDDDGVMRGFGLDESHPDVARLAAIVNALAGLEHQAVLNLSRAMRKHPLGPWCKAQKGVGDKQAARLLAAVGDPYWNTLHARPRTVSELWAYCGLHVLPAGRFDHDTRVPVASGDSLPADLPRPDNQIRSVGRDQTSDPGQATSGTQTTTAGVAAKRRRGQRCNWSADAKMRAYLVAVSCMKVHGSPYRDVYLARREHTAVTHPDWTPGHSHNDALRVTSKAVLRDLWREAKRLHQEGSR